MPPRRALQHRYHGCRFPDGVLLTQVPPPAQVPADPVAAVRADNDAHGLRIHSRTALPLWQGDRLNVGYAIDVLHPVAIGY